MNSLLPIHQLTGTEGGAIISDSHPFEIMIFLHNLRYLLLLILNKMTELQ